MSYTNYNYTYRRNRILEPAQLLAASDIFHPTSDQRYMLGCILDLNDGRRFRYCENAGVALIKAGMVQSSVPIATWTEMTNSSGVASVAVGATEIKVTITTTACAVDDFADGWLNVVDDTPAASLGDLYSIKSNDAGGSGLTPTLQITDAGGLRGIITTSTALTVLKNKYKDVVIVPAGTATAPVVGVTSVIVAIDYFFWAQTRGPASILVDNDTVVVGDPVSEATTTGVDGACGLRSDALTEPNWGTVMVLGTAGQTDQPAIVDLMLE